MDIQSILIFILAILTVNLIAVGIYVVLVLKEFRETVRKANDVLDNVHEVTDAVANPITSIAGIISGVTEVDSTGRIHLKITYGDNQRYFIPWSDIKEIELMS